MSESMQPARRLAQWSIFTFVFALCFWVWAIVNTATKGQGVDLGIISFFTVMISSGYMYHVSTRGEASRKLEDGSVRIAIMITYGLVVLNYMVGTAFGIYLGTAVFTIYCAIFVLLWTSFAYRTWDLTTKTITRYEPLLDP
jgi:hypothetical protein